MSIEIHFSSFHSLESWFTGWVNITFSGWSGALILLCHNLKKIQCDLKTLIRTEVQDALVWFGKQRFERKYDLGV